MKKKFMNIKLLIAGLYFLLLIAGISYLVINYNISDFFSYEFIRSNKDTILLYKRENFIILALLFFIFCIVWTLSLGFAGPLLIFAGFVFGQWWGIFIVLTATTIGATLLYMLAGLFFRDIIEKKLAPKFSNLKKLFKKNELFYFMCFRFVGGGGTPYGIQNILPVLFNMNLKKYIVATYLGSSPSMFVTVALGNGIENVIDKNVELSIFDVLISSEIYIPIIGFFTILILGAFIKKFLF